jgi:ribosomal protein S20
MTPETRKLAETYVKKQLGNIQGKVPASRVKAAIKKVAEALEEVRVATAATQNSSIILK